MRSAIVLVHGAWHGAWAWDRVLPLLTAAGVPVTALDLPGRGASTAPLGDLHADAKAVTSELERHDSVILVGHSYGGAVITEAGHHPS
ncbi:MAG: alpha/beta fold hydrolase, partial [Polyangiales bacterium]